MNQEKDKLLSIEKFKDWKNYDGDLQDALFHHFDEIEIIDWCDISDEGRELYSVMFNDGDEVERDSPIDYLLSAVAAGAANGVFKAVASALGIENIRHLEIALSKYYDEKELSESMPAPIGYEGLKDAVEMARIEIDSYSSDN